MAFFKEENEAKNQRLRRVEHLVWVLVYGGLLSIVLGMFIEMSQAQDASDFYIGGGIAVFAGVVLIYVRAQMRDDS